MSRVLFVCLHNAGRSQMSRALFDEMAGGQHVSDSAGSQADPRGHVHPPVAEVMNEIGLDMSARRPKLLTRALVEQADVVVTMGCGDECPDLPGKRYIDWDLPDPKGQPLVAVREVRDNIRVRVGQLVADLARPDEEPQNSAALGERRSVEPE